MSALPAAAAQPPAGYPTSQVLATVSNPDLGSIPIRRGFYDADSDTGFGSDKAWHKHNITSIHAQEVLMGSTNHSKQGNGNYVLRTYTGYYNCDEFGDCTLETQQEVYGIYAPNNATYIQGWPVGGKVGLFTAYCNNDDKGTLCAKWVTYGIDHPGEQNPYPRTGSTTAAATSAQSAPDPTNTLGSAPSASSNASSAATQNTGYTAVSYSPLPQTVHH